MSWLDGWSKRLPITIDPADIPGDLSDFPLMVKLSAASGKNNADITQLFGTLFDYTDIPGVSLKEHDVFESGSPASVFSKPTSTSARITSNNSAQGSMYIFFSVHKELLPPGTQVEFSWETGGNYGNVGYFAKVMDGKFDRTDGANFPYEDSWSIAGYGTIQQLDYEESSSSQHTIKDTLDLDNSLQDYVTFVWYVRDHLSGYNTSFTLYWCRFLDAGDNVIMDVDLSGDLVSELTGTYQDYSKIGDPDTLNHNIGNIALTTDDGETQLPVEIESWNFENEEIILWTKTDLSNSTDTTLYLYYDENQAGDTDYVGAPIVQSTANLVDDDCSSLSGWTNLDNANGDSRMTVEGGSFEFFSGFNYSSSNRACRHKTFTSGYAERVVIEFELNHRRIGTYADNDKFQAYFRGPDSALLMTFAAEGLYLYDDTATWNLVYPHTMDNGVWYSWVVDWTEVATGSGIVDVYMNGHKVVENTEVWGNKGETYPSGNIFFRAYGAATALQRTNVGHIKVGTDIVKKEVWDDDHIGVWHMDRYPATQKGSIHHLDVTTENMGLANTVTGTLGRALQFNGTDERLYTGDYDCLDSTDLTVSTLFKPDASEVSALITRFNSSSDRRIWALKTTASDQLQVIIGSSDGTAWAEQALTGASTISGAGENHVAFTFSDGTGVESVYINGESVGFTGTQTYTSLNQSDNDQVVEIGSQTGGSAHFDGMIDEVRISSTVRSDNWMETDYASITDSLLTYGTLEITPLSSPDTVYCIYDNPIYNVSTSGIEIYNVDVSTDYYIAYATLSGVNAIAESNEKLLIGTTTSGILYIPTTTITNENIYSPQDLTGEVLLWKQYPDILDNYVKDISACGDYVCAVTASGVDHFNLGRSSSYDHSSGLTAAATKCFQTCRGRFYYAAGTKIVTIYTHQCDWTEGTIGYEYDSTISGTLLPPGGVINDISVVEGTSIYNGANLIFAATSSGVALIEERPGNEANSRYKWYLLEE